jgi:2-polyprenyl-6-methoxyphenol hydroxylase-like FAD-dependent oxidoreductase
MIIGQSVAESKLRYLSVMTRHSIDVLIIGGGLVGLYAAKCLQAQGFSVKVFERMKKETMKGSFVGIMDETISILRESGVDLDKLEQCQPDKILFQNYIGEIFDKIDRNYATAYMWHGLHDGILDLIENKDQVVSFGTNVTPEHVKVSDDNVTVSIGDETYTGSLIIYADGVRSAFRMNLTGNSDLRYAGWHIFRGSVEETKISDQLDKIDFPYKIGTVIEVGKEMHAGMFNFNDGKVLWALYLNHPEPPRGSNLTGVPSKEELESLKKECVGRLSEGWQILSKETDTVMFNYLYDLEPLKTWIFNKRSILIGDAAHPMTPNCGLGANVGLADSYSLAKLLGKHKGNDLTSALIEYEKLRIDEVAKIVDWSRRTGEMRQKMYGKDEQDEFSLLDTNKYYHDAHALFRTSKKLILKE